MSVQNQKTIEVYQKVAKNYIASSKLVAKTNKNATEETNKSIQNLIKDSFKEIPKKSKVLEVGSADGKLSKYIEKLGYNVTPSDVADDFLIEIKKNGLNPIKFNILEDDFKDKYKAIVCWRVFVHFTKKDSLKALKKSYEALEDDGIFILSIINRECKKKNSEWVDFPDIYHLGEKRYFNYYSKEEMDKIITKTKFKIKESYDIVLDNNIKWLVYVLLKNSNNKNKQ